MKESEDYQMKTRKVILNLAMSLDGYLEGINGEVDWCMMEPEIKFYEFLDQIDTILYGRKSFELWGTYQPNLEDSKEDQEMWVAIHNKQKIVFSSTLKNCKDAILIKSDLQETINKLKQLPGKDLWLYGGAELITSFLEFDLIDEFQLAIHPVVLGEGKALFHHLKTRLNLKLIDSKTFSSGLVQLTYIKA